MMENIKYSGIEKNILNLVRNKEVSVNDLIPITKMLNHSNENINLAVNLADNEREKHLSNNLLSAYIYSRGHEDYHLVEWAGFLIEETNGTILSLRSGRMQKTALEELLSSRGGNINYSQIYDNNLAFILKNTSKQDILSLSKNPRIYINSSGNEMDFPEHIVYSNNALSLNILLDKGIELNDESLKKMKEQKVIEVVMEKHPDILNKVIEGKPLWKHIDDNPHANYEMKSSFLKEWVANNISSEDFDNLEKIKYFNKFKNSGAPLEHLKSRKDWDELYDENGVSAARYAIKEKLLVLKQLSTVKKAKNSLNNIDKFGRNIWFDLPDLNFKEKYVGGASVWKFLRENIDLNTDNDGYGFIGNFLINGTSRTDVIQYEKYGDDKYHAEMFNAFKFAGPEGVFGIYEKQEEIAKKMSLHPTVNNELYSVIAKAFLEGNQLDQVHPKLQGVFIANELVQYSPNMNLINTILLNNPDLSYITDSALSYIKGKGNIDKFESVSVQIERNEILKGITNKPENESSMKKRL